MKLMQSDDTNLIENRLEQCLGVAREYKWSPHKTSAVCKYLRKSLEGMTKPELEFLDGQTLVDFVKNAAVGWDRYRASLVS